MNKPFSQACENNKQPILAQLERFLTEPGSMLEIGSGTGQHAVHFAAAFPHILWQPSDLAVRLPGIDAWRLETDLANLSPPITFDVNQAQPVKKWDHLYSANTLHIMSWPEVELFFNRVPQLINPRGFVFIYGPFKYQGHFTSDSNAQFDQHLKQNVPHQGIRDFEAVNDLAHAAGLSLLEDKSMPANNQMLVWQYSN